MANANPKPGYYPDGSGQMRWWNGETWGELAPAPAKPEKEGANATVIAGFIFAVLFPIVGFILGLTQVNRSRYGLTVVLASVAGFVFWIVVFLWLLGPSSTGHHVNCGGYYSGPC
jgi:hypothetical protein